MYYQLHDYEIDSVTLENDKIIFSFPEGFYAEDENGQPLQPTPKKLVFMIDKTGCEKEPLESFIEVRKVKKGYKEWKEISFKRFVTLFKKGNMCIHDEYDSKLTNWKIIQLNACTRWGNMELRITDVADVACLE